MKFLTLFLLDDSSIAGRKQPLTNKNQGDFFSKAIIFITTDLSCCSKARSIK
jgi:hypothetical protein